MTSSCISGSLPEDSGLAPCDTDMATIKYTEKSPYQLETRREHHTDYKYTKYLGITGAVKFANSEAPGELGRMNIALFGLGRAGSIHLVNIITNPRLRLMYIIDEDLSTLQKVQQNYDLDNSTFLTPSEENTIFSDPNVHGIVVATPTFTHESLVAKGLMAGKAVLCEKPISQDEEGTRRCYKIAEQMGKPLLCAFNRRFDPGYAETFRQVQIGHVGRVQVIKTIARDSPLPPIEYLKLSGGIFHDCAVHDIDAICWILGEYPEKVFAVASTFIPEIKEIHDYDTVAITLVFSSGTIGMIDLSRNCVYGYDQRLEVFGAKGMLSLSNESPMQLTFSNYCNRSQPPIYHSFASRYHDGYKEELHHFCDIMQGKAEVMITGENTLKISKIANALEESVKSGKLVTVQY